MSLLIYLDKLQVFSHVMVLYGSFELALLFY